MSTKTRIKVGSTKSKSTTTPSTGKPSNKAPKTPAGNREQANQIRPRSEIVETPAPTSESEAEFQTSAEIPQIEPAQEIQGEVDEYHLKSPIPHPLTPLLTSPIRLPRLSLKTFQKNQQTRL
jgi:hypothetical protein